MTSNFAGLLLAIATLLPAAHSIAQAGEGDWPSWRGPLGTGVAPQGSPPVRWSETENVKWKIKVPGQGTATPIIWQDKIFIQAAIPTGKKVAPTAGAAEETKTSQVEPAPNAQPEPPRRGGPGGRGGFGGRGGMRSEKPTETFQFVLLCLDRKTGEKIWDKVVREELPHEGHHRDHGFSSSSPTTDGQYVIAYFGSRGLHCFDLKGNLKWEKDLGRMETKNDFGEGSSPALFGDTIVVNWDHEGDDFIAAFDRKTGNELWRKPREEDTSWTTPLVIKYDGKPQAIVAATAKIRSYDLANGELLWECSGLGPNAIPTPVANDQFVFATTGFRGSSLLAIKLGQSGDLSDSDAIAWRLNKSTPYVPSPLLYDNRLYFFASNNAVLSCHDAETGKPLIEATRVEGLQGVYASPVGAGGNVFLVGRNGTSMVIKHADELEVLSTNVLEDRIDASPAIAGSELFLRGHEHLYCIAE